MIEFVGLPGVGKTTIAVHVAEALAERGIAVDVLCESRILPNWPPATRGHKLRVALAQALLHPVDSVGWCLFAARSRRLGVLDSLRILHRWLFLSRSLHGSPSAVRVLDQGLLQALWSALYRADDPRHVAKVATNRLGRRFPTPAVIAGVRVDEPTWRERLSTRPHAQSRLERLRSSPVWEQELTRAWECMGQVHRVAEALSGDSGGAIRYVEVDNTDHGCWDWCVAQVVEQALIALD
jgi:hypothetical protein